MAGLRPERSPGQRPWLQADHGLGPTPLPVKVAAQPEAGAQANKHWVPGASFWGLSATPKAERPAGPAALRSKAGWAVGGCWVAGLRPEKRKAWAKDPCYARKLPANSSN